MWQDDGCDLSWAVFQYYVNETLRARRAGSRYVILGDGCMFWYVLPPSFSAAPFLPLCREKGRGGGCHLPQGLAPRSLSWSSPLLLPPVQPAGGWKAHGRMRRLFVFLSFSFSLSHSQSHSPPFLFLFVFYWVRSTSYRYPVTNALHMIDSSRS